MGNTYFYREMRLQKVLSYKDVMITMGNIGNHAITSPIASLSHYLPPEREQWNRERVTREKTKKLKNSNTLFLRYWHNKKTSHISPFRSGGDREQGTSFQLSGIAQ